MSKKTKKSANIYDIAWHCNFLQTCFSAFNLKAAGISPEVKPEEQNANSSRKPQLRSSFQQKQIRRVAKQNNMLEWLKRRVYFLKKKPNFTEILGNKNQIKILNKYRRTQKNIKLINN